MRGEEKCEGKQRPNVAPQRCSCPKICRIPRKGGKQYFGKLIGEKELLKQKAKFGK